MATYDSFEAAREQAADYLGFVASVSITTKEGVFEIPNPSMLDDDQQDRVDALHIEMESWDRHEPPVNADGSVKPGALGPLRVPYRRDGEPVNYNVRLAKAIFGDRFEAFKAAGGRSSDVELTWSKMNQELAKRRETDSKSGGSDPTVAAVPNPDSE